MRSLAKFIYRLLGWRKVGDIPENLDKFVLIAAPHTSWHDFYMALLLRAIINQEINFVAKKELFKPPFGWYFKKVGGRPIDRTKGQKKVSQIAQLFKEQKEFKLAISPEGTRKKVEEWKTGFYYIAVEAGVPIVPIAMDFKRKEHRIYPPFYPTGNIEEDLPKIKNHFKGAVGKVPQYS